jgi:hypothetical protein
MLDSNFSRAYNIFMKRVGRDVKNIGSTRRSPLSIRLIMRLAILAILASLITGCATRAEPRVIASKPPVVSDPIDQLIAKLSPPLPTPGHPFVSPGGWDSGMDTLLVLPAGASTKEIVAEAFRMSGSGQLETVKIMKVRQVHIPNGMANEKTVTAALVNTKAGEKIVLFKYWGPGVGWWNRIYDAN